MPIESQLYFAGANPEEMMENKFYRSAGIFPQSDFGKSIGNFQMGGGLNLRAFSNYCMPVDTAENQTNNYRGHSGFGLNMELEFGKYIPIKFQRLSKYLDFNPYLFGDAGFISTNLIEKQFEFSSIRADAGIGFAFTILKFGKYDKIKPLTLRFDFPLYLSNVPSIDPSGYKFRWVFAINRAF
jgi:aminopeptidase N